ncbi:MAG: FprA family A-type flavoprotein [Bacteroidales bacterium]
MKDNRILDITKDVKWIGVLDFDIVTFDVVMETKFGTTYNSYFINAEKKAIIETSKEKFWDVYENKIRQLVNPEEIEFIILNHTEPDHSGNLKNLLRIAPNATVVGTGNAIRYLKDLMGCDFKHLVVKDGHSLDLGNKTLKFISAPNLHWPDSMYTYLEEDKLLFTCDSFGCHYANEKMYDDQVGDFKEAFDYYFDVILKPFSRFLIKAIEKIRPLEINAICTGHGPLLTHDWKKWVDYSEERAKEYIRNPEKDRVFIPYVSAYQKTGILAVSIAKGIRQINPDIDVDVEDIENMPLGELDQRITQSTGIIVGCPTINQNILLPIYKMFAVISPLRDRGKLAGGFGSYGWSGEGSSIIESNLRALKLKYFEEGVFVKFSPDGSDINKAIEYGEAFAKQLLEK